VDTTSQLDRCKQGQPQLADCLLMSITRLPICHVQEAIDLRPRAYSRMTVTLRLDPEDVDAVRREAVRRMMSGAAERLDLSRVVRELIRAAPWHGGTEGSES